jgi:hypothetical protein
MLQAHLVDGRARARRRQQGGLPAHRRGAERDQEAVAVLAEVQYERMIRQQRGEAAHVGAEGRARDAASRAERKHARGIAGHQRRRGPGGALR